MSQIEQIENFEAQSLQQIALNMCKWFGFNRVKIETQVRSNVESGIWIIITMEWDRRKRFSISAQRNELVKERLIKWLREHREENNKPETDVFRM